MRILRFSRRFQLFGENQEFRENGAIAKTPIIPREYQRFWRVDYPQNVKYTQFTGIYEIL